MAWELFPLPGVKTFLMDLQPEEYREIDGALQLLAEFGPNLRAATKVKLVVTSRHRNMKELRCSANGKIIRILFAFDQKRRAVLLVGGDKSEIGFDDFYSVYVPIADDLFDAHLAAVETEEAKRKGNKVKSAKGGKRGKKNG